MVAVENDPLLIPRPLPKLLSLIFPVFNEEQVLPLLQQRLLTLAPKFPCPAEFIFVNDGSRDGTARFLVHWAKQDKRVKVLQFSRNFGHQAAVTAGLDHARGEALVIMDADLQDPPELVLEMLELYQQGYDVVYAQRQRRDGETLFKKLTAKGFYWLMRKFIHRDLPMDTGDFRLLSRDVAEAFRGIREGHRFVRGLVAWLGFQQTAVLFDRPPRPAGETKYSVWKMSRFAWDAIISFSRMPLSFAAALGSVTFLGGCLMGVYALYRKLVIHDSVPGWPTLVILQCLIGGVLLLCVGVLGEYVGRIYEEIKRRPLYIVKNTMNLGTSPRHERTYSPAVETDFDYAGSFEPLVQPEIAKEGSHGHDITN